MKAKFQTFGLVAALAVLGSIQPLKGGFLVNIGFVDAPLFFTSTWEWHFAGGGWATAPLAAGGPNWAVTLQGIGGLALIDISTHLTNPHGPPEIAPNVASFFIYPGAALGIGPVFTMFPHPALPGHIDVFDMTVALAAPGIALIDFNGVHLGQAPPPPPPDDRFIVPEPSNFLLLSLGLGLLAARKPRY